MGCDNSGVMPSLAGGVRRCSRNYFTRYVVYCCREPFGFRVSYLELQGALSPDGDVLVETLLGIIWQLEGELGAPRTTPEQLCTQHL